MAGWSSAFANPRGHGDVSEGYNHVNAPLSTSHYVASSFLEVPTFTPRLAVMGDWRMMNPVRQDFES